MENACCGMLEGLHETYELPFYLPLALDENHIPIRGPWTVQLFMLTPSGNINEKFIPSIELTFCPFCGERLIAEEEQ